MAKRDNLYDIVILGGGSAGIVSGVMAGGLGLRVLLIERARMGGECLNTGCVPSKALLHAAKIAHSARTADQVGLRALTVSREDAAGVMRRVRETIDLVREADATEDLLRRYGVEIRHGAPRFLDPHTVQLGDARIRAERFILATGSHPVVPAIAGMAEAGYRTNQTIFDLDAIPAALLVIGGGPIGVEMAQAFGRLGSRVTLVQREDRLLPRDDCEVSAALTEILRGEGIEIRTGAEVTAVRRDAGRCRVTVSEGEERTEVACDELLVAVGRAPNSEGLDLAAAGVEYDRDGVHVDGNLRTTAPHIYACGDLLSGHRFSHMAEYEAKIAVRNIVFPGATQATFRVEPWATFTDPEAAHLGLTEEEARARGIAYEAYRQPFAQNDRALTDNAGRGFIKVLTQGPFGRILGVHILGPNAGDLLHEWILAMEKGHSIRAIGDLIHVYPTLSMVNQHAAQRWYERKAEEPIVRAALETYVRAVRPHRRLLTRGLIGAGLLGLGVGMAYRFGRRRA